jgi:hypothetical protein
MPLNLNPIQKRSRAFSPKPISSRLCGKSAAVSRNRKKKNPSVRNTESRAWSRELIETFTNFLRVTAIENLGFAIGINLGVLRRDIIGIPTRTWAIDTQYTKFTFTTMIFGSTASCRWMKIEAGCPVDQGRVWIP